MIEMQTSPLYNRRVETGKARLFYYNSIAPVDCFRASVRQSRQLNNRRVYCIGDTAMKVNTCSTCGKRFWSSDNDSEMCFTCAFKLPRIIVKEPVKQVQPIVRNPEPKKEYTRRPGPAGYVYVMKSAGRYKIGMTSRESGRLDEIKRMVGVLKLICQIACNDAGRVETYLHKKYKKQRITHEWYKLTKEDLQWFKSLRDYDLDGIA